MRRRLVIVGVIAVAIFAAPLALTVKRIHDVIANARFSRDIKWVGEQEKMAMDTYRQATRDAQQQKISLAQFADIIESRVLPMWQESEHRLARDRVPDSSRLAPAWEAINQYVGDRQEEYTLTVSGLRRRNNQIERQAALVSNEAEDDLQALRRRMDISDQALAKWRVFDKAHHRADAQPHDAAAAYEAQWDAFNNGNHLDERDGCYKLLAETTQQVLILDKAGLVTDVVADADNAKAQCFRQTYLGTHFPAPQYAPYYLYLKMG